MCINRALYSKKLCQLAGVPFKKYGIQACTAIQRNNYSKEIISSPFPNLPTSSNYLKEKLNDLVIWYEQLTGMDEVRMMQNRVLEAQDRFVVAQENRRDVGKELTRIQSKLKEIHSELDTTSRGEERYLQLVTEEHAILKQERRLVTEFALLEREERESFNVLSASVKESHEKERAQAARTKYWSIIGSIIGTVIGIAGSSINNEFKMRELRKLVRESALRISAPQEASNTLVQHEQELAQLVSNMREIVDQQTGYDANNGKVTGELTDKLENILQSLQNVNNITSISSQVEEMKGILQTTHRYDGQLITIPHEMESMMIQQQQEMRILTAAVTIMGIIVPIIVTLLYRP